MARPLRMAMKLPRFGEPLALNPLATKKLRHRTVAKVIGEGSRRSLSTMHSNLYAQLVERSGDVGHAISFQARRSVSEDLFSKDTDLKALMSECAKSGMAIGMQEVIAGFRSRIGTCDARGWNIVVQTLQSWRETTFAEGWSERGEALFRLYEFAVRAGYFTASTESAGLRWLEEQFQTDLMLYDWQFDLLDAARSPDVSEHLSLLPDGRGVTLKLRIRPNGTAKWSWRYDDEDLDANNTAFMSRIMDAISERDRKRGAAPTSRDWPVRGSE